MTTRLLLVALAGAVLLVGCGAPPVAGAPDAASTPADTSGEQRWALPVNIEVPAIEARSELMNLGLDPDGSVEEPPETTPEVAGWYRYSPVPGQLGAAVILGHINGDGRRGVFADLIEIRTGDVAHVDLADGTRVTYQVDRVQQIAKAEFPTDAVYGPVGDSQIRLVSCGGPFDDGTGHYLDNIIVYGTMI